MPYFVLISDIHLWWRDDDGGVKMLGTAIRQLFRANAPAKPKPDRKPDLVFKSAEGLFEVQCKLGDTKFELKKKGTFAVVQKLPPDINREKQMLSDGKQQVLLKVASEDGGFRVIARTLIAGKPMLQPGDPVIWLPLDYCPLPPNFDGDRRFGYVEIVLAKVSLSLPWQVIEEYS